MVEINYKIAKSKKIDGFIVYPSDLQVNCIRTFLGDAITVENKNVSVKNIKLITYIEKDKLAVNVLSNIKGTLAKTLEPYRTHFKKSSKYLSSSNGRVTDNSINISKNAKKMLNATSPNQTEELNPAAKTLGENLGLNSRAENNFIRDSINDYLSQLKLKTVDFSKTTIPMHYLSTIGDSQLKIASFKYVDDRVIQERFLTNANMRTALQRLGFHEFYDADEHTSGSLFETIYAIAVYQRNTKVTDMLETALFGIPVNAPKFELEFLDELSDELRELLEIEDFSLPSKHKPIHQSQASDSIFLTDMLRKNKK